MGVSGAHLAASLGGVRALYPHWWHRAAGVWRVYVGVDRIRAPALSLLQGGVRAGGVSLEFRRQEMAVISPVTPQAPGGAGKRHPSARLPLVSQAPWCSR